MIALKIKKTGPFMAKLLGEDTFDLFLLEQAQIQMAVTWEIDGRLNRKFYDPDAWKDPSLRPYDLTEWKSIRPHCYNLIRGRQTPAGFLFVLRLKPELTSSILEKAGQDQLKAFVSGFIVNIRYQEGAVQIVTAVSYSSFTLDKSAGEIWDKAFASFLTGKKIDFDSMQ